MKLKVWTMVPSRTFDGEYFIFIAHGKNYNQAVLAAIAHCEKTRGYKPEKVEKYQSSSFETIQEEQALHKKSRWVHVSERIRNNPPLRGAGEYVRNCSKEFREDFALNHSE